MTIKVYSIISNLHLLFVLYGFTSISAQLPFSINAPIVDTLEYTITDSVYVSPDGHDDNIGSSTSPLKTFKAAIDKLPFNDSIAGITHSYGLVIIKEGAYDQSFIQTESQWRQGDSFKNISVRGEGQVIIGGQPDTPLESTLMLLRGSHIYVKNIQLKYGGLIGLYLSGEARFPKTMSDIIIQNVVVDSVASHGLLINYADRVMAKDIAVLHSSGYDPPVPPYPCRSWPSGFKPYFSNHVTISNSYVKRNWGEGINFHNCQYGMIENCQVSDNFGTNIYSDNSSKFIIKNNFVYNTPEGTDHWRSCFGFDEAALAAKGISLANERSCPTSRGFIVNRTIDCALECIHPVNGTARISTVDSIFIFNNIILNTGAALSIWEGVTELATACMSNIYFVHNTCIGMASDPLIKNTALVNFNFASGVNLALHPLSRIDNTYLEQNIFSFDQAAFPNLSILRRVLHPAFPSPFDVTFNNNMWNHEPDAFGYDSTSFVIPDLINSTSIDGALEWDKYTFSDYQTAGKSFDFMAFDFFGRERHRWTQGAIEGPSSSGQQAQTTDMALTLFPNPTQNELYIRCDHSIQHLEIIDMTGRVHAAFASKISMNQIFEIPTHHLRAGSYILKAILDNGMVVNKSWFKL